MKAQFLIKTFVKRILKINTPPITKNSNLVNILTEICCWLEIWQYDIQMIRSHVVQKAIPFLIQTKNFMISFLLFSLLSSYIDNSFRTNGTYFLEIYNNSPLHSVTKMVRFNSGFRERILFMFIISDFEIRTKSLSDKISSSSYNLCLIFLIHNLHSTRTYVIHSSNLL